MSNYNDENTYLDGEEKKPKLIVLLLFIILLVLILVIVISCGTNKNSKKKSSTIVTNIDNNYLSYINVSNSVLSPTFNKNTYNYTVSTEDKEVYISCEVENKDATVEGCNETIKISESNATHYIRVTNGLTIRVYTLRFDASNIANASSKTNVLISSLKSSDGKSYILSSIVSPANSNVTYKWFKDGKEILNSNSSSYTAKESGTYYLNVKANDSSFDVNSNEITINIDNQTKDNSTYKLNIDSISGNSNSWTQSVTLTVNATSSNGLAEKAYSFDGGKTYQASNKKTFTSNQTVKVFVKDVKGNTTNKSVTISKIDTTTPKVSIKASNELTNEITLTANVSPSKVSSGYKYQWYKDGKEISKATSNTYKATSSGKYRVKVSTGAGKNVTSTEYSYVIASEKCPRFSAYTNDNKTVLPKTWINEEVRIIIYPSKDTIRFDVYANEAGNYNSVSNKFTYYESFTKTTGVKFSKGGMRYLKVVSYDKNGNTTTCYSNIYFIK